MGTITLSVPNELKSEMDKTDIINWSSVARHAFSEILEDVKELQLKKKIREISEISKDDTREVRKSVAKEVVESTDNASKELRLGKRKAKTLGEFNKWCSSL